MQGQRAISTAEVDAIYDEGWKLAVKYFRAGPAARRLGNRARKKLSEARDRFNRVLQSAPNHWQSMWALGKIYQAADDPQRALGWFRQAFEIAPKEPDVGREAAVVAMETGEIQEAIRYAQAALTASPRDCGLAANLSLALLLSGEPVQAREQIEAAMQFGGMGLTFYNVRQFILDVNDGRLPCPRSWAELHNAA